MAPRGAALGSATERKMKFETRKILRSAGRDEVFVGRFRGDDHRRARSMFVVADNLRKGTATNAVQLAELVMRGVPAGA
jgi:aspartate-semialdehyde dehydrogenase